LAKKYGLNLNKKMITRIVKMVFTDQGVAEFVENFNLVKTKIRGFEGCEYLELWKASTEKNTFFTYSRPLSPTESATLV